MGKSINDEKITNILKLKNNEFENEMKKYFGRICIAFRIFVNALLGGKNNQTFSAGQYARRKKGLYNCVFLIDIVFFKRGHCKDSWVKWEIINASINHYDNKFKGEELKKVLGSWKLVSDTALTK